MEEARLQAYKSWTRDGLYPSIPEANQRMNDDDLCTVVRGVITAQVGIQLYCRYIGEDGEGLMVHASAWANCPSKYS